MAVEAHDADEVDAFLHRAIPPSAVTLLSTPLGPEKEALLAPLVRGALARKERVVLALGSIPPRRLLKGIRVQGTDIAGALKAGRLRVLDWYSHKEEMVPESEEKEGIYRCRADLSALEEAMRQVVKEADGKGLAAFEIFTELAARGPAESGPFLETWLGKLPEAFDTVVLAVEAALLDRGTMDRLREVAQGTLVVHRRSASEGPTWSAILRREGEEVRYTLEAGPLLRHFTPVEEAPREGFTVLEGDVPGDPCPQCGTLIEGEECLICGYAPSEEARLQARSILEKVEERLKKRPTDLQGLYTKAAALAKMDQYREAIGVLNELTIHDPRYPGIWMLKAKLYDRLGETAKAHLCRQRAVSLEGADLGPILDATLPENGEEFQCPLCQRWLPWDATFCPCGAEFVEGEAEAVPRQ